MIRRVLITIFASALTLVADPPRPVTEVIPDVFTPVPSDLQRLGGLLAGRMRANSEGYLEHIKPAELAKSLEGGVAKDNTAGRTTGLLLEAATNAYDYSDDAHLKAIMSELARVLITRQESNGYIGSVAPVERFNHEDLSAQGAILLGLVAYSRVSGNDEALVASKRLANTLVAHLARGKGAVADAREIIRPLLELYRATSDNHYLAFCRRLATSSFSELGTENDTYSFLSFLSGLVDLYQLTGDEAFAKAAESGWTRIQHDQLGVTGVPRSKENAATGCLTQAWMRLNLDLLRLRGDARYADQLDRTVYNQLLASQDPETGKIDACVPASGTRNPVMKYDPCSAAVSLAISDIPEMIWGRHGGGIAILAYQPGHATLRTRRRATLQLYTESTYPANGNVLLHIEPSHDVAFPLQLLVPSWTKSFVAEIGSTRVTGKPGQYLTLQREWKKGDTVRISIDMTAVAITDTLHSGERVLQRGPQILALTSEDTESQDLASAGISPDKLSLQPDQDNADTFLARGTLGGKAASLTFVPFADADAPYRLWVKISE